MSRGEPVPGIPGNDVRFAAALSGAELSPDDSDLLIAAIGGQPVIVSNGAIVEPTIKMKNVDLSTGNLAFEGTIVISGDIAAGMEVKASGDIIVGGMVEAAMLEAKGNVEVKGGIIFCKRSRQWLHYGPLCGKGPFTCGGGHSSARAVDAVVS